MNTYPSTIIGAGLAGLIAAHAWPSASILEQQPAPPNGHKALLRFRSDAVARLTGIEFKKVRVRKGIWHKGAFHSPTIQLANMYAQKCIGVLSADRSIWSIKPSDRFIAPDNFLDQLLGNVGARVQYGVNAFDRLRPGSVTISTAPLPITAGLYDMLPPGLELLRAPIYVRRFDLGPACDVYQTIYFPDPDLSLYRASITGRTLIVEFAGSEAPDDRAECYVAIGDAFGLRFTLGWKALDEVKQHYGKIAEIDEDARRRILFRLTHEHQIFSLGRFATWRNILLDDVVKDIDVVKRLMRGGSYELRHAA